MVRKIVGDEALIESSVDALLGCGRIVGVGLLIGKLSSSKDVVVALVPTPPNENGEEAVSTVACATKKAGKSSSDSAVALTMDINWVAEHARQVSRMLLGGMQVVGFYCLTTDNVFKQSNSIFCQVSKAIALSAPIKTTADRLVLHIASSPRRLSCRVCSSDPNGVVSLKPCEWRLSKIVSSFHSFACCYNFDLHFSVAENSQSLKETLNSVIASEARRIDAAEVAIDGCLMEKSDVVESGVHHVDLFLPLTADDDDDDDDDDDGRTDVVGRIHLKGCVQARAYSLTRQLTSLAVAELKEDIVMSLRNRIKIMNEEEEEEEEGNEGDSLKSKSKSKSNEGKREIKWVLPKRVFIPWNGLLICDYLLTKESNKDTEDRCRDLFGIAMKESVLYEGGEEFGSLKEEEEEEEEEEKGSGGVKDVIKFKDGVKEEVKWFKCGALLAAFLAILFAFIFVFLGR